MNVVPIRPKESKLERFARLEAIRLATRPEVHRCGYDDDNGERKPRGCGYRLTSHSSGYCRSCRRWLARIDAQRDGAVGSAPGS